MEAKTEKKTVRKTLKLTRRGLAAKVEQINDFLSHDVLYDDGFAEVPFFGCVHPSTDEGILFYIHSAFDTRILPVYETGSTLSITEDELKISTTIPSDESKNAVKYIFHYSDTPISLQDWNNRIKRYMLFSLYEKADIQIQSMHSEKKKEEKPVKELSENEREGTFEEILEWIEEENDGDSSISSISDIDVPEFNCQNSSPASLQALCENGNNELLDKMLDESYITEGHRLITDFIQRFVKYSTLYYSTGKREENGKEIFEKMQGETSIDLHKVKSMYMEIEDNEFEGLKLLNEWYLIKGTVSLNIETAECFYNICIFNKTKQKIYTFNEFVEHIILRNIYVSRYINEVDNTVEKEEENSSDIYDISPCDDLIFGAMVILMIFFMALVILV